MHSIFYDAAVSDDVRRGNLFQGQLYVYSPRPISIELCNLASDMTKEVFAPHEPREAQHHLPVGQFAKILADLKPRFIHHPECKRLLPELLRELSCDLDKTYFDVPRLRTSTSDNFLSTGISYAFHPHRDTWYSAPQCQLNWWIPVFDVVPENVMAFHPYYWSQPVRNSSRVYNYAEWNRVSRFNAAQHIGKDTRIQPMPQESMQLDPQIRVVLPVGGILIFSGAQMHSTVPNTSGETRFSIDFRTVHIDDVISKGGAPNIDSACTGTSLGDFLRASDLARIPNEWIAAYDTPLAADSSTMEV
jgi:hypothetical protein